MLILLLLLVLVLVLVLLLLFLQGFRYVGMKAKVEYQARKGFEEITMSETARWWIYTFLRGDAHLKLARINIVDNVIADIEHKDMVSILPNGCLFKYEIKISVL